jgi:hypothetical protein
MVERPSNRALIVVGNESSQLPALIANVGPEGTKRFFEFFTVPIRNAHTLGLPASHIVGLKAEGALKENSGHRPVQYLGATSWNRITGLSNAGGTPASIFAPSQAVWRTIGYEAMHMIRKGQACWGAAGAKVCLLHRFILDLFAATN